MIASWPMIDVVDARLQIEDRVARLIHVTCADAVSGSIHSYSRTGRSPSSRFFMSTTVQPRCMRLVERLVERADVRLAVVGVLALGVGVVDDSP